MRALFVIPNLTFGGVQTQVLHLAKHLKNKHAWDVVIWGVYSVDQKFCKVLEAEGIAYEMRSEIDDFFTSRHFQLSWYKKLEKWNALRKRINEGNYSVIFPYTRKVETVINFIKFFTRVKVSFSFERGGAADPRQEIENRFSRIAKWSSLIYVSNSHHGKVALAKRKSIDIGSVHVIQNAYIHTAPLEYREKWLEKIEVEKNKLLVVMVANFFDEKDHATLIKAWKGVEENINAVLVLAGAGKMDTCISNMRKAKDLVIELRLVDSVFFIGAIKDTGRLLQLADIGVLSTRSEGCPNAILEYMGAKLPIVATKIPGTQELIPLENQDCLFDVGNIQQCTSLLKRLLDDASERQKRGEVNYNHVMQNFSNDSMFEKYDKILRSNGLIV